MNERLEDLTTLESFWDKTAGNSGLVIKVGDTVKCHPWVGPSFLGTVRRIRGWTIDAPESMLQKEFDVEVVRQGDRASIRTFRPDQVSAIKPKKQRNQRS